MDGGGFEPPKSVTTDLQSAPFGHSGIHPYIKALRLATRNGFEPSTSAVTGRRSNQLSHRAIKQHIQEITLVVIHHFNQTHWISPRPISNCQLNVLLHLHLSPIYLVLFKGSYSCDGISHLEVGFTLRCLQRLSIPNLPTLLWD